MAAFAHRADRERGHAEVVGCRRDRHCTRRSRTRRRSTRRPALERVASRLRRRPERLLCLSAMTRGSATSWVTEREPLDELNDLSCPTTTLCVGLSATSGRACDHARPHGPRSGLARGPVLTARRAVRHLLPGAASTCAWRSPAMCGDRELDPTRPADAAPGSWSSPAAAFGPGRDLVPDDRSVRSRRQHRAPVRVRGVDPPDRAAHAAWVGGSARPSPAVDGEPPGAVVPVVVSVRGRHERLRHPQQRRSARRPLAPDEDPERDADRHRVLRVGHQLLCGR